jgi:hypothetical protein
MKAGVSPLLCSTDIAVGWIVKRRQWAGEAGILESCTHRQQPLGLLGTRSEKEEEKK